MPPRYERSQAGSKLDRFKDEIHQLLKADAKLTGVRVREEIEPLGYDGGKTIVDDYLGFLISDPEPVRRADVGAHVRSYGFRAGHLTVRSFLAVIAPIDAEVVRGVAVTPGSGEPGVEGGSVRSARARDSVRARRAGV
jgi:hypothetical protein